jgi:hypothetical protein
MSAHPPLPRRVIDVGHRDAYILESGLQYHDYVAVSHRWEDSMPLKTTKANLQNHCRRLVWSDLSTAFQEAIDIVRSLNIRFLWIDSLCIVQDDLEEWEMESARMASIYENAKVTIALYQPGPNQSVYPERKDTFTLPLGLGNFNCHLFASKINPFLKGWVDRAKLSERGWCFQVSLLDDLPWLN